MHKDAIAFCQQDKSYPPLLYYTFHYYCQAGLLSLYNTITGEFNINGEIYL